jgi:DNA-3-methyladenine glycosylase II
MDASAYRAAVRAGTRHLVRADPLLRKLVRRHGACGLAPNWTRTPYQALVQAVLHQQLAGAAARTIHDRFVALFAPKRFPAPEDILAAADADLRAVGLSRQKSAYVRDIAARAMDGTIPRTRRALAALDDESIIARLTTAHGVGRWTAEMLLIFTLGRLDVLPVDDYGVRTGYARSVGLDAVAPRELRALGERWSPYRSIVAWYLWRAADA